MPIQNSFIFREPHWGSPPESFIQKCWLVSEIQCFELKNYFLMPFSLWNWAFLTIFDFKALYFWNQSIFLNETFRRASSLRFPGVYIIGWLLQIVVVLHSVLRVVLTPKISRVNQISIFTSGWVVGITPYTQFCPIPSPHIYIFFT